MDKKLSEFVKQQAKIKADPDKLREGLILHGWDKETVDKTIKNVYGKNQRTMIYAGAIVAILLVSLFLVFKSPTDKIFTEETPKILENKQYFQDQTCTNVDVLDKDDCYFEKIEQGYNCDALQGNDLFFCNRALEYYLLS